MNIVLRPWQLFFKLSVGLMNTGLFSLFAQCHDTSSWLFVLAAHQNSKLHREFSHLCRAATYVTLTMICACVSGCVCVCDAVIFYSVVLALDMFSLNWSVEKHMWEWFPFTSDTLVTDWTDCSHCCLNVTLHLYSPWQKPHMLFLYIKQKQRGPVCDCFLSFFICLCKHSPVLGEISLF